MSATPFKVERSEKAWYFDTYYFHCIDCGAEHRSHRCDNRTNPYCPDCKRKHDKERAMIRKKEKEELREKKIRNKAIDDFLEKFCDICCEQSMEVVFENKIKADILTLDGVVELAFEVADEFKC